jgi:hypothetical protein
MIYLTFLSAILLSGIAAYYSVIGLAAIFTGAFWPVVIMGSSLEFAKLVTASWLYRNWKTSNILLRSYLTIAVILLMLITSMGIFGFLSKAHIDSTLNASGNNVELSTLTQEEKITKERLDYLLARAKDPSTASNRLDKQIQDTQKQLNEINNKKLPLLREETKLVADIGPIKYVADMFFGSGEGAVDKAVRLVIFIIMLVFDPLAVLLLIASNISLVKKDDDVGAPIYTYDNFEPPTPEEKKEIYQDEQDEYKVNTVEDIHKRTSPKDFENITKQKVDSDLSHVKSETPIYIDPSSELSIPPLGVNVTTSYDGDAELSFKKKL